MRLILAIMVLLAGLKILVDHGNKRPERVKDGPIEISAEPLALDSSKPHRTEFGDLHFLGAWRLSSPNPSFGGLSALLAGHGDRVWALSDSGIMYMFPQPGNSGEARARRLPDPEMRGPDGTVPTDSESMAADPTGMQLWVGYEQAQRICMYAISLRERGHCKSWREIARWPKKESLESMVRLPGGRFLLISEGEASGKGGREAMMFNSDPVDDATPPPYTMTYMPPEGYNPTDAVWIGNGKLLVLSRRATLYAGFTASISVVDISSARPGAVLQGRELIRFAPPLLADNFEGLAIERRDRQRILWVISDDNHLFFQRTLLLKFSLADKL